MFFDKKLKNNCHRMPINIKKSINTIQQCYQY